MEINEENDYPVYLKLMRDGRVLLFMDDEVNINSIPLNHNALKKLRKDVNHLCEAVGLTTNYFHCYTCKQDFFGVSHCNTCFERMKKKDGN